MTANTQILKIKGDWQEVADDCRLTAGRESLGKNPSWTFRQKILIAEHSPIRDIRVKWRWRGIMSFVATHFSRHKWECFISTQRSDRVGHDTRSNTRETPVDFVGEANLQHLIDTWRKRLCCQSSDETRAQAENFKLTLRAHSSEISDVLVPNCVYRCGCPEIKPCERGLWPSFLKWSRERHIDPCRVGIEERYRLYNEWFLSEWSEPIDAEALQ